MIGYLKGNIIDQDLRSVIVDISGVGYKIYTNTALLEKDLQKPVAFWTYLAVRENALDLYGFTTKEELRFFELLLTVSGIGPKSALGILSVATLSNLRHAIASGDTGHLTKVSGIGRKNAEKIVVELRDKIEKLAEDGSDSTSGDVDTLEALKSLGYSERESREALKKAVGNTPSEKIKSALKNLGK
ncbi:MAG: Holliday junction branch migration protein RuvA [bacterium]